jgi:hypothetical protein
MKLLAPSITRWKKPTFGGGGAAACAGSSSNVGTGCAACCFSPVHSRKLPQVPQNVSASAFR